MEEPISRLDMAKRRAKRLGLFRVVGQMAFAALVVPALQRLSRKRAAEIREEYALNDEWENAQITKVDSVNSEDARSILRQLEPDVVVVNGTRIIGGPTLECVDAKFINTHAGITPLYRGVHGGYWALVEGHRELVGTTVHAVDKGIDTGNVIAQACFEVTAKDNFSTYPLLHTAVAVPILLDAIEKALSNKLTTSANPKGLDSKLRYHPTIFEYFRHRLLRGVK